MATTGRYFFTPCVSGRISRPRTLAERFRRWNMQRKRTAPDLMMVTGYFPPVTPRRR